jgi:cyclopropane fatty-acyl-phospholipid synthase-like methyltransferase
MLQLHHLEPETICEVGCGAGEVVKQLHDRMSEDCQFWGYDISPQAIAMCQDLTTERLHYKLADIRKEHDSSFDLVLVLDVVEHLEDYFSFLRDLKPKSQYKIFHIPLDLSLQTILRGNALLKVRRAYGHLTYFSRETALQTLQDTGYEILDYFYTAGSIEMPAQEIPRKLMKRPRKLLFAVHKDWAVRLLGGFRLLVLAK